MNFEYVAWVCRKLCVMKEDDISPVFFYGKDPWESMHGSFFRRASIAKTINALLKSKLIEFSDPEWCKVKGVDGPDSFERLLLKVDPLIDVPQGTIDYPDYSEAIGAWLEPQLFATDDACDIIDESLGCAVDEDNKFLYRFSVALGRRFLEAGVDLRV